MWHKLATACPRSRNISLESRAWLQKFLVQPPLLAFAFDEYRPEMTKKGVPEGTPLNQLSVKTNYGVRNRKNCDGVEVVIGMALENAPAPSNTLWRLVVHVAIGFARLVVVNQA